MADQIKVLEKNICPNANPTNPSYEQLKGLI